MSIYRLGDSVPIIDGDAWVHPEAVVLGDVRIGAGSSVWPGAVLRGDFGTIVVGARTSIQDNCTVHTASGRQTSIGDDCIVGHRAHLEDCTLDDAVLVGSGSIVLEVRIPTGAAVAAGAVVLAGTEIRPGHRAQGVPAREVESAIDAAWVREGANAYVNMARRYRREMRLVDASPHAARPA